MIYGAQSANIVLISDTIPANAMYTCKTRRLQERGPRDIDLFRILVRYSTRTAVFVNHVRLLFIAVYT